MEPLNSCSLGAMGSLLMKLDELLRTEERAQGLIADLRIMSTKMKKLSEVHSPPHTVKYWMNDARELSYDMEVCVDQFVHASEPEDLPAEVAWKLTWTEEILGFEARVKEVNERCERYNLVNKYVLSSNPAKFVVSHHRRTLYKEPDPVGMEEPTNKLLEWLMPVGHGEEDLKLKVVSVLGDEGVGKSTLAKRLWRLSEGKFGCQAFVQTAKKPDTRMILRSILSQVRPKQPLNVYKVPKLIDHLREHLQDKRYFIIIDDLWDVSVWQIVRRAFPAGNNQRIIITTAVDNVAHLCCSYDSNSIVNVKCLGADQAKKLFIDRAFGSENGCPPQFNDVTDEIARKCGGFPLAIICTARILASQPETEQDQQLHYVNNFLPNNLRTHSTSVEILNQVLKLCYSSLPHCLKTCLLYLSMYPENYLFLKEDLVKQWVAEDFICTPEGKDNVDVAGSYFDELLSLGLIQQMDTVKSNKKGLLSYTVHPAVFDFITCKSMEDNFTTIIDYSHSTVVLSEKVRRLSLHFGSATYATTPESVELSQVRSLSFFGLLGCMPLIAEFKLVRVMILHICCDDMDTRFSLSEICNLLHLRYLQVRCNVTVDLPKQMQCLKHLGTLEIDAGVEDVPSDIGRLSRLCHVRLGEKTNRNPNQTAAVVKDFSSVDWSRLPCPSMSLESFELRHPICIFSTLANWFIQLHKLRVLEIVVRQLSNNIDALAELPVLKHLSLYVRTPSPPVILRSGMFPALEYFKLVCGVLLLDFQEETLPNLRKLKVVFNAHKMKQYGPVLVGIEHLLGLERVVASIGLAPGAEESDRIAAESAFKDATRKLPSHRSFEEVVMRRVDQDEDWNEQKESSNQNGQLPLWKLAFRTPPQLPIFTGTKIEGEAGNPLEVILMDADTGSPPALPVFGDFPPLLLRRIGSDRRSAEIGMEVEVETDPNPNPNPNTSPSGADDATATASGEAKACANCHTTKTPLWRGGPEGPKSLCNACGIRYRKWRRQALGLDAAADSQQDQQQQKKKAAADPQQQDQHHLRKKTPVAADPQQEQHHLRKKVDPQQQDRNKKAAAASSANKKEKDREKDQQVTVELLPVFGDFPPNGSEDWSADEFQRNVVKEREGKRPLLTGDVFLTMRDGRATVGELWFTDNSSWVRCHKFRIGARVVDGSHDGGRIVEAITEAFMVRDYQPVLADSVWRLEEIGKDGALHRNLRRNNIETVQDFLRMLTVKPDELRAILGDGMSDRMWEATAKHARTCEPGNKVYVYTAGGGTIYVNSVFNLVKVEIDGMECPLEQLNWDQMALVLPLVMEAYENRHDLQETSAVTFDGDATDNIALLRARFAAHARGDMRPVINNMVPNPWIIQ